jgi:O-antigen/teichoic acid export membrane protein
VQLRLRHFARSILSNWLATAATLAVGFFLAPFVVHRLGNLAYGVWILAISCVNYLNLLDLGFGSSMVRFLSKGHTTKEHEGASEAFSGVVWVRLQIAGVVLALSACLAGLFPYIFNVPPALVTDAREAVLIIGISSAVSMTLGVFSFVLSALNRYDLRSYGLLTQLAIRVLGVVTVLRAGHGIVAIAFCELLAALIGNGLMLFMARRIYPELTIKLKVPRKEMLRQIWSYSLYAFLLTIASQLIYQSGNLVVGAFVSASAVTFYSIGNSLCRYTQQFVAAMTITFTPAASSYEAGGRTGSLRTLYYNGTRATLAVSLPILVTLLTRGDNFISIWMGPQYAKPSGTVLVILATALLFSLQNLPASAIAWGVEKHKMVAKWAIPEAIANLTLSVVLARSIGMYGVAIAMLVPSMVTSQILWPRFVVQLVGVGYREVLFKVWTPVYLCAIPFALVSYAVGTVFPARNMTMFVLQTLALVPVFGVVLVLVFRKGILNLIPEKMRFGRQGVKLPVV